MHLTATPLELTTTARDVSVTERGSFRSCRRRWYLEVIDNLTPKAPAWALEFGTGIHAGLEAYYLASSGWSRSNGNDPLEIALAAFGDWYAQYEQSQIDLLGPLFTDDAKNELWNLGQLGYTMLSNYDEYATDLAQRDPWEIVAVEGQTPAGELSALTSKRIDVERVDDVFSSYGRAARPIISEGRVLVPIVHPTTRRCLPGKPFLSARIDLLIKRRSYLWVVDHKTTASTPNDRGIDFEDQITGYSYVVFRLTGMLPRGTIFNYLVKQSPKEPRAIQPTRDNPAGLSTAKDQLCLARDYRRALLESGMMSRDGTIYSRKHADCYAALLASGWDPYFKRFEVQRNLHEVMHFEERLYQEYKDMRSVYKHPERAYPNPSTWHCPLCSVAPICQAMMDGSDVEGIIAARYMQAPDRKGGHAAPTAHGR